MKNFFVSISSTVPGASAIGVVVVKAKNGRAEEIAALAIAVAAKGPITEPHLLTYEMDDDGEANELGFDRLIPRSELVERGYVTHKEKA